LLLTILGRNHEAVVHARRAAELDPLSIQINNTYGIMLYNVAQLDSALRLYQRIVTNEPDSAWVRQNPWVLDNFGKVSGAAGRYDAAFELLQSAAAAVPGHPRPLYHMAAVALAQGDTTAARAAFTAADPTHPYYRTYRGMLEARLGDLDAAFDWFEEVEEWGQPVLNVLVNDRELRDLRRDARYAALLHRIGLPPQPAAPLQ
jgi:tetratricopeptide (TPR) repeat protein